ncbi:MAG: ferrous iron transport protein B [Desulfobacterales bacterium]|nr:ferrous iron transport protein B [Desulfobacterales bacterium]
MTNNEQAVKKIMIAGLPNTGKSLIFSNMTGMFTLVANSPITTIILKKAFCKIYNETYEVIDTPGLHSLYIHSEEELIVRNAIFSERPDVIIQCFDANLLKQSLTLTLDLLTLGIPLVICLNAVDETSRKGIWIDSDKLSRILGVPVVESIALQAKGVSEIKEAVLMAKIGKLNIRYGNIIEDGLSLIENNLPADLYYKHTIAFLCLINDTAISQYIKEKCDSIVFDKITTDVAKIKQTFKGSIIRVINNSRNNLIDDIFEQVVKRYKLVPYEISKTLATLSRHPIWGIPIFVGIMYIMFFMVVHVANHISEWMDNVFWVPVEKSINEIFPVGFWHDFLIGNHGVLSLGLANALLTILPILTVFFFMYNILEDTGYIPNLSVLTRRLLRRFGLSGSAIMPLSLGFGCKTMATLTTKILKSRKEKYIAIYLIAFGIPCAAQLGVNMSILGMLGAKAFAIVFSVLIFIEVSTGIILNKVIKSQEEQELFIMELPPIRLPSPRLVLKKTYYRLYWFLRESLMVFIYAALTLFTFDKIGVLNALKNFLNPIVKGFLGLPLSMVDAIILSMVRREAAGALMINLIKRDELNYVQAIVAVVLTSMLVPCFANIMAMIKELGTKSAIFMTLTINISSFLISGALNHVLVIFYSI